MKKINIHGVIGIDARSSDIIKQIEDAGDDEKVFEIHSPGGSVMEGLAIYNAIRQACGISNIKVLGLAASMASVIAMAKGKPDVAKRSVFMMHNAQMFAQGDYHTLQKAADLSNKISEMIAQIYAENSKKSKKAIHEMMDNETYLFGEQIRNEGFAKNVYDDEKEEKEEDAVALAQLEIEDCIKKMQGYKEDFAMAAMMIDEIVSLSIEEIQNPYPNEHSARVRNPDDFEKDSFRRKNIETGIDIIIGRLKGKTTTTAQAYRFKKDKFTAEEAKKWLKDHDIEYISFEAASESKNELNPAATRDNINQEVLKMTLKEFLDQDPAARKEYDDALTAKFDAGVKSIQDRIAGAMVYIKPDSEYPGPIRSLAIQVVEGKVSNDSLSAAVATYDALVEKDKSKEAQDESAKIKATGQQLKELSDEFQKDGTIKSETDLMAVVNQHKTELGMEVN